MLARRPFKQAEKPERQPKAWPGAQSFAPSARAEGMAAAQPKIQRAKGGKDEATHKANLARLGCMVCRRLYGQHQPGPVELHHYRGGGWGKGDYTTLMPLCYEHHRGHTGVHGLGTKAFSAHYGFDQGDLLNDAARYLSN